MAVRDNIGSGAIKIVSGNGTISQDTRKTRFHVDLSFKPDFVFLIMKRNSTIYANYWRKGLTYPKIANTLADKKANNSYGLEGGINTIDDTGFYLGCLSTSSYSYEYVAGKGIPDDYTWIVM